MTTLDYTEALVDVQEAREAWLAAQERERNARRVLVATVREARTFGASLEVIGGALRSTRQYVHKLLKAAALEDAEQDKAVKWMERQVDKAMRDQAGPAGRRNCFVCGRIKPRISDRCDYCGDDPVGNTTNGDPDRFDRMQFEAAYAGNNR